MATQICIMCNKAFYIVPARKGTAKFCSVACKAEYQHQFVKGKSHPRWTGGVRVKVCEICGKEFMQNPTEAISTFSKRRFCSQECGWIGQKYLSGEEHPLWTGGKKKRDFRHDVWAKQVISRDKATCQKCGVIGIELHAHHIKSFIDNEDVRFDIDNGITLCHSCHWDIHSASIENGVNSGKLLTGGADKDNPEPSENGNILEGVTTNGRAYRRFETKCSWCGTFISKRLSQAKGKEHHFCSKSCMGKHRAAFTWNFKNIEIPSTAVIPTRAPCPKGMI